MVLTPEDVELLKQLKAAGECGCNIRGFNTRVALQRLARGGYVVARAGVELVNYRITKRGELEMPLRYWFCSQKESSRTIPTRRIHESGERHVCPVGKRPQFGNCAGRRALELR